MDPASRSKLKHQVSCSQEESESVFLCMKRTKKSSLSLPSSPLPPPRALLGSGLGSGEPQVAAPAS